MKNKRKTRTILMGKKGVAAVLTAILIAMLLGFAALAVDIGYGMVTKNELQNIADSAALAAARRLGTIYQGMTYEQQLAYIPNSGDETLIKNAAVEVASQNKAGGLNSIVVRTEDIFIGTWDTTTTPASFSVNTPNLQPNAIRVIARRDGLVNGSVVTFFARVFGMSDRSITARATAAMTGQSTSSPGELQLPVGLSRYFFDTRTCGDHVAFSPSNSPESCAGWTSWEYNSNDAMLRQILNETKSSPEAFAYGTDFNFIGGQLSNPTFSALLSLFQRKGYDVYVGADGKTHPILDANGNQIHAPVPLCQNTTYLPGSSNCSVPCGGANTTRLYYADGTPRNLHEWPTTVVVYQNDNGSADCTNPNQDKPIVGFARIRLDDVCNAPDKIIRGVVECNYVEPTDNRGGGGSYGVLGPIPGLVQ